MLAKVCCGADGLFGLADGDGSQTKLSLVDETAVFGDECWLKNSELQSGRLYRERERGDNFSTTGPGDKR
jgi:hypothetical protein